MLQKSFVFTGHSGSVYALENGTSDETFYSGSGDSHVVEWNAVTQLPGEVVAKSAAIVYVVRLIKETNTLLIGNSTGGIHVIDLASKKEMRLLQFHKQGVFDIQYSFQKNLLAIASGEGIITFCRLNDFSIIKQVQLCNSKLRSLDFNMEETLLAVGCGDGRVVIFNTANLEIENSWQAHKENWSTNVVCFHPMGNLLLTASRDAMLNVYDVKNNFKLMEAIPAHNYAIYDIQFHPSGDLFATASRDKSIKLWNASDVSFINKLDKLNSEGHVNSVNKILWLPLQHQLISAGDDRAVILWKTE